MCITELLSLCRLNSALLWKVRFFVSEERAGYNRLLIFGDSHYYFRAAHASLGGIDRRCFDNNLPCKYGTLSPEVLRQLSLVGFISFRALGPFQVLYYSSVYCGVAVCKYVLEYFRDV